MPVKRRVSKRRVSPQAEAEAWRVFWETGWDFFGDAAKFTGLTEPVNIWPPEDRGPAEAAWKAASEDAWRRVGHLHEGERYAG
jgi:hypothetical protein